MTVCFELHRETQRLLSGRYFMQSDTQIRYKRPEVQRPKDPNAWEKKARQHTFSASHHHIRNSPKERKVDKAETGNVLFSLDGRAP
jgi:hypothetical protein